MSARRLSIRPHALVMRLHTFQREKPLASKPEAQAEGNRVFEPRIAFPRLAPRASTKKAVREQRRKHTTTTCTLFSQRSLGGGQAAHQHRLMPIQSPAASARHTVAIHGPRGEERPLRQGMLSRIARIVRSPSSAPRPQCPLLSPVVKLLLPSVAVLPPTKPLHSRAVSCSGRQESQPC